MHSGRTCQLRRTAGVPGAARGHSGMPERTDPHIYSFYKMNHCLLTQSEANNHKASVKMYMYMHVNKKIYFTVIFVVLKRNKT